CGQLLLAERLAEVERAREDRSEQRVVRLAAGEGDGGLVVLGGVQLGELRERAGDGRRSGGGFLRRAVALDAVGAAAEALDADELLAPRVGRRERTRLRRRRRIVLARLEKEALRGGVVPAAAREARARVLDRL